MELIVTHIGADFDAFASMLAAQRLHPGAGLFFPGSREESVRRMLEAGFTELVELRQREVDPRVLRRIVLCDIRQRHRLGVVAEWLDARPDLEIIIYDHHPPAEDDLAGSGGIIDATVGATSTLLAEELGRRRLAPDPNLATLMLMGIYEDTGSLSYPTVAPRDLAAVAWLLGHGGDLAAVRRFALRSLDGQRLEILHAMTEALVVHRPRGHRVGVVALPLGRYVDELAPLVSRCLEIFELPLLFALFGEEDRVTLIARGDVPGVDLGEILASFCGGGGHPTAAAGTLRGATVLEAQERLLAHLERALPPAARAKDLMLPHFFTIPRELAIGRAKEMLNERQVNALPVTGEDGRVLGAVSRQLLDAAIQHGLDARPVERVMQRELEWVDPEAPAEEIGDRMVSQHPRFVLVGDPAGGRPLGLVTRMEVLRHLHSRLREAGEPLERRSRELRRQRQTVARLLDSRLPPALRARVRAIAQVAGRHGIPVYLVGGLVRDLLLERENRDLDLVVEGDGPHFAHLLAAEIGARVRVHEAFLTAAVIDAQGLRIDVATARSEFYRAPAALPQVQTSALRQDLYRRDFTINTLAVRLGPEPVPELIDYFGGRRDLRQKTLRVLHSLSFIDDPTRVLRAVRLELRLGFSISSETQRLMEVALAEGVFDKLSGARLRDELILLLEDPMTVERALERLDELALLRIVDADLGLSTAVRQRVREAVAAWDWYRLAAIEAPPVEVWRLFFLALALELPAGRSQRLADRLLLCGEDRRVVLGAAERLAAAGAVLARVEVRPHQVVDALAPLTGDELLLLMALADERGREWVRRLLTELRPLRLGVRGADLVARGFPPGPAIGRALRHTWEARVDGQVAAADELRFALSWLAREGDGGRDVPTAVPEVTR